MHCATHHLHQDCGLKGRWVFDIPIQNVVERKIHANAKINIDWKEDRLTRHRIHPRRGFLIWRCTSLHSSSGNCKALEFRSIEYQYYWIYYCIGSIEYFRWVNKNSKSVLWADKVRGKTDLYLVCWTDSAIGFIKEVHY